MEKQHAVSDSLAVALLSEPRPHLQIVREGGETLVVELSEVRRLLGAVAACAIDAGLPTLREPAEELAGPAGAPAVDGNAVLWATVETTQEAAELLNRLLNTLKAGGLAAKEVRARHEMLSPLLFKVLALMAEALDALESAEPGRAAQRLADLQGPRG